MLAPRRLLPLLALLLTTQSAPAQTGERVSFNRDIRPILSDACFHCHGPDRAKRKADLHFDTEEGARADLGGYAAIAPGKPGESELLARVSSQDDEVRMPPEGHPLTDKQISVLRAWVEQGATVPADDKPEPDPRDHWAFRTPVRPPLPVLSTQYSVLSTQYEVV